MPSAIWELQTFSTCTTMEETFQLFCTAVEKGGATCCHVPHGGSALPTPPTYGMVRAGSSTRTGSRSASKALWKKGSHSKETALRGDKQSSNVCILSPQDSPVKLMRNGISGLGLVLMRRPGCARRSDAQRVKEIRLRATCVYTGAIHSHVLASKQAVLGQYSAGLFSF